MLRIELIAVSPGFSGMLLGELSRIRCGISAVFLLRPVEISSRAFSPACPSNPKRSPPCIRRPGLWPRKYIRCRIMIGNPLILSPDFPPFYTVRETFTSYGVPSTQSVPIISITCSLDRFSSISVFCLLGHGIPSTAFLLSLDLAP